MDTLFEFVKTVGALGGLGASAFLIYDRALRDRPLVSLSRGEYGRAVLRIVNPADDVLLIRSISCEPKYLEFAHDESIGGILSGLLKIDSTFTVKPKSEVGLGVVRLKAGDDADRSRELAITIRWQRSRHWWPGDRTTRFKRSIAFIRDLEKAKSAG